MTSRSSGADPFPDLDELLGLQQRTGRRSGSAAAAGENLRSENGSAQQTVSATGGAEVPTAAGSAPALVSLEGVLQRIEARAAAGSVRTARTPTPTAEPSEMLIRFEAGGTAFAVPMRQVLEIAEVPIITWVPGLPQVVPGVGNLRGEVVLLVDLARVVGRRITSQATKVLLLHQPKVGILGGVLVDRVLGIAPFDESAIRRAGSPIRHGLATHETDLIEFAERSYSVVDLIEFLWSRELGLPTGARS